MEQNQLVRTLNNNFNKQIESMGKTEDITALRYNIENDLSYKYVNKFDSMKAHEIKAYIAAFELVERQSEKDMKLAEQALEKLENLNKSLAPNGVDYMLTGSLLLSAAACPFIGFTGLAALGITGSVNSINIASKYLVHRGNVQTVNDLVKLATLKHKVIEYLISAANGCLREKLKLEATISNNNRSVINGVSDAIANTGTMFEKSGNCCKMIAINSAIFAAFMAILVYCFMYKIPISNNVNFSSPNSPPDADDNLPRIGI